MAEDTEKTERKKDSFNWLRRENRGPTYISYSPFSKLCATSFEFGADGCVASCNAGGELLHLAAPSKNDGLIFVRGDFETSLYSSLARAQGVFGGPSTFGFEVAVEIPQYSKPKDTKPESSTAKDSTNTELTINEDGSSFLLGELIERGSFNYRWPFSEYSLLLNDDKKEKTGTCVMFSFVKGGKDGKDGMLYQVIRIEEGCAQDSVHSEPFPEKSQIALNIGGPLWFQSFASPCRLDGGKLNEKGDVRDVSPESTKPPITPRPAGSPGPSEPAKKPRKCIRVLDTFSGLGLEAWVFQLCHNASGTEYYEPLDLTESLLPVNSGAESGETYKFHIPSYTAFGKLPDSKQRRDATFVAAFRLTEVSQFRDWISRMKDEDLKEQESEKFSKAEWWPEVEVEEDWLNKLPSSAEIYDYVGASPRSVHATGAMWETAFLARERKADSESELAEVRLLGRCLEKILQVDLVPEPKIRFGTALVSNIFSWPNVDLKATFWKLRYLVKVYKFLLQISGHHRRYAGHTPRTDESITDLQSEVQILAEDGNENQPSNDWIDEMMFIASYQLKRVHKSIESVMRYLVQALLTPKLDTILMPDNFVPGESNYYYVMLTLWYIANNYPWETGQPFKDSWLAAICQNAETSKDNKSRLYEIERLPKDNCNFGKDARDRIPLLMWYHYSSLLSLCKVGWLPEEWDEDRVQLERKVARLGKVANVSTAAKLSSNQNYAAEDEIVDRLAFLAHELGLEKSDENLGTVTSLTKRRVKQRDYTRFINPGRLLPLEEGSTSSPWEIHALCHHSRLVVFALEKGENFENFEEYKKKLCEFMNSEATIVPCWEREHSKAFKGWLRSEVTAVVGTTLLKLREIETPPNLTEKRLDKKKQKRKKDGKGNFLASAGQSRTNTGNMGSFPEKALAGLYTHDYHSTAGFDRVARELIYIEHRMDRELHFLERLTGQSSLPTKLDWLTFRPPARYHPDNFTISLEDTPQFYKDHFVTDISVPIALEKYVKAPTEKGLGIDDLKAAIKNLPGSVSIADLVAMGHRPSSGQRLFMDHSSPHVAGTIRHYYQEKLKDLHEAVIKEDPENPEHGKETRTSDEKEDDLSRSLIDSLVDQQVQHRLLAVRKLSKNLLKMLLYVIHPEAAACLSTHVLCYSRFSSQRGNMWSARITLRSWIKQDSPSSQSGDPHPSDPPPGDPPLGDPTPDDDAPITLTVDKSSADDDAPITFPEAPEDSTRGQKASKKSKSGLDAETSKSKEFKLTVSSLIISTNSFGDFSKLTLISETIDESRLARFATECQTLWQKFVNQPQTARCLIFLLALGVMCERLAVHYNEAIEDFSKILKLDEVFFNVDGDGSEWIEDHESISQFQMGLRCLDALYKLQRSLQESVGSIIQAKTELISQINEGPGRRSDALQRMCDEYLASFEGQLVNLTAVSSNLNRKIEFNGRFKDALSAIIALRDGRASLSQNKTSIKQNSTIERLTYFTIAYLPLGLLVAILAIPTDHPITFPFMSRKASLGLVLIILICTYGMAIFLEDFLKINIFRRDDPSDSRRTKDKAASSAKKSGETPSRVPTSTSVPSPSSSSMKISRFSLGGRWRRFREKNGKDNLPV